MTDVPKSYDKKRLSRTKALSTAAIAIGFGLVGFGTTYVLFWPTSSAKDTGQASIAIPGATPVSGAQGTPSAELPRGPGSNALSVGDMAMFVFKSETDAPPTVEFNDAAAQKLTFADFRGKVILVNLWATWCAPCIKEMPDLASLQKQLGGQDFEVVAISLDRGSPDKPAEFLKRLGADNLRVYHDPTSRIGSDLKFIGLPASVLLDRHGNEVGRLVGPANWAGADAVRLIQAVIAAK